MALLCSCLVIALTGCNKPVIAQKADPPRPVRSVKLSISNTAQSIELPAEVRPRFETRYGFRVGGKIAARAVNLGERVRPGQELARIDPTELRPAIDAQTAQLEAVRTDVTLQAAELRRVKELRDQNFISQAQVDRQQAAHDAAVARMHSTEAQLKQARNSLEFTVLRADKPGVVTAIDAEAGQVVGVGQSVIRVAQLGEKEVTVNVPERDVERLRSARKLSIQVDALNDRRFGVRLRELSPLADPASRTFLARLTVIDATEDLKLGMSATLNAELAGDDNDLVVPLTALRSTGEKPEVWVIDPVTETVQPVVVRIGQTTPSGVSIASGLKAGDLIVTAGANLLIPGQKVRIVE